MPFGRRRAFHATTAHRRDHHFDTLKFVQRLKDEGFSEDQAVAMMKVLSDVIEESIQNLTRTMVLREDQEKATYTQKVDFAKLRSELLAADSTESSMTRASHERLTNDIAKLNSRLRDEISRTQASVRLDLNLEKGRIREEANVQELKVKETETRIEQEVAGLRERVEGVKFSTLQWLINDGLPEDAVKVWAKTATTPDITTGIRNAIDQLLAAAPRLAEETYCITIGTTHFLNAILERDTRILSRVGVIRLASNGFTQNRAIYGYVGFVDGGLQIDGTEIGPVKEHQVIEKCEQLKERNITNVVVVGVYSPIESDQSQEGRCKEIFLRQMGSINVICSVDVGQLGILERENAAILNASVHEYAKSVFASFRSGLAKTGLGNIPLFISCNDGSMMPAAVAENLPILAVASGAANSMLGAAYLISSTLSLKNEKAPTNSSEKDKVLVLDIGGTSTDAGALLANGIPRQASAYSEICGVRANFAMPDVISIGLGGGSIVKMSKLGEVVDVGPESVGQDLITKALCFGGDTLTATDIAVAAGDAHGIGNVNVELDTTVTESAKEIIRQKLSDVIDSAKTVAGDLPVALVGGGSILVTSPLKGVSRISNESHGVVANAIGAATARVQATIDVSHEMTAVGSALEESQALEEMKARVVEKCVTLGASKSTVEIIEQLLIPMAYVAGKVRIIVKAAGGLDPDSAFLQSIEDSETQMETDFQGFEKGETTDRITRTQAGHALDLDVFSYQPSVIDRQWYLSSTDLEWISIGCYILGCGGGGSPQGMLIHAQQLLERGETLRIIDAANLPLDAKLPPICEMGSPMPQPHRHRRHPMRRSRRSQRVNPLLLHSPNRSNLPMIDGDLMGQAFPTYEKITPHLFHADINDLLPVSLASGDGTMLTLHSAKNAAANDRTLRAACVEMGCAAGVTSKPLTAAQFREQGIPHTHSLAWRLGRAVKQMQRGSYVRSGGGSYSGVADAVIDAFGGPVAAKQLFDGKIVSVSKRLVKGHSYGEVIIERATPSSFWKHTVDEVSPPEDTKERFRITFKNENLLAEQSLPENSTTKTQQTLATVPDLIILLDARTGLAVGVPEYRYGIKVAAIAAAIAAAPAGLWATEKGVALGGPEAFG
ncbi:MAG: hypothetical protein M1833_006631 [Piccolia ochrophora]|nr:MAG: hypothetical protein M1833_006631 [Piccolia ochrophora]